MRSFCPVSTAIKATVVAFIIGLIVGLTVAAKAASATPPARPPATVDPVGLDRLKLADLAVGWPAQRIKANI